VSVGRLLKELGFAHVSARPRHPKQDQEAIETFKKGSIRKSCWYVAEWRKRWGSGRWTGRDFRLG
jgi:hypothetical protein